MKQFFHRDLIDEADDKNHHSDERAPSIDRDLGSQKG